MKQLLTPSSGLGRHRHPNQFRKPHSLVGHPPPEEGRLICVFDLVAPIVSAKSLYIDPVRVGSVLVAARPIGQVVVAGNVVST